MAAATFFSRRRGGGPSFVKEYEIITLKCNGRACRLYLFFCTPKDIILYAIRPGSTKFAGKYFYKLTWLKGWQYACWRQTFFFYYSTYQTKFDTKMTKIKWNYTVNMIMSVSVTVCHLILYFPIKQGLAINLPWPALKNKQCMCFKRFEAFLTSSADLWFFLILFILLNIHGYGFN